MRPPLSTSHRVALATAVVLVTCYTERVAAVPVIAPGSAYRQLNLVADYPGVALVQDPLLVNPWGIALTSTSPFWVANNGTSTSTLYRGDVSSAPLIRPPGLSAITIPGGLPTGTVANTTNDFVVSSGPASGPGRFIFASITGNIAGWNPNVPAAGSTTAVIMASQPGHVYTGLAIANNGAGNFLYAADFANGNIDVYDATFTPQPDASFPFDDPSIPTSAENTYHPYNIQAVGGSLYVTYAKVGPDGLPVDGVGNGFVRRFNANGVRDLTFGINNGPLNAPWGVTVAPATFGIFSGALLIGNFGEGNPSIHAFNPTTGAFLGSLQNEAGEGIVIDRLWALTFGNGGNGGDANALYFAAGIGNEEHGLFGSLRPTTASATSLVQFSSSDLTIGENAGHVDVTVTRDGDVSGTATVNYATFDVSNPGRASQRSDYELALGRITFHPGETSKTFRILLVDDRFVEGSEAVDLILSNPTGAGVGLGAPNVATLTIADNDAVAPTSNPIDDPAFFVRQHYLDFLNRVPDNATLNFLVGLINPCGNNLTCRSDKLTDVSAAFFLSAEFQETGQLIYLAHKAAFGTVPFYGQFIRDRNFMLEEVAVGTPGWTAQLEARKQPYLLDFMQRPEFVSRYPGTMTNEEYVDALYANAGVTPTAAERQAALDEFNGDTTPARARVLRRVTDNAALRQAEFNRSFIYFAYFAFYRRDPDTAGFNARLSQLNAAGGDFRAAGTIEAFITSDEYRNRFGSAAPGGPFPEPTPPPTPSQPLNISTRLRVGTDEKVLIGGFIVTGAAPKKVIARGIGPSLTRRGVGGALQDPVLQLHGPDGSLIATNDNWRETQAAEIEASGIPPEDDRESAIVATLPPNAYTAVLSGANGTTGVGLVEIYDLDAAANSRLANISTRGFIESQSENDAMFAGFILGGTSNPATVLIRALSPLLEPTTTPINPTVELYNQQGTRLATNDDWRDRQQLETLALEIAPELETDSVLIATVPAAPYTAIVTANDSGVGVALVEVYNLR